MLRLDGIHYTYPGGDGGLRGASARMGDGITLLAGPNAGGKTTLLRVLAGLLVPAAGRVTDAAGGAALSSADLRRLGRMLMQDADLQLLGAEVGEDVMLGRAASALPGDFTEAARSVCDRFGLGGLWHEPIASLSYGQKRKLCLANALLANPKILLLDEPFAGLDYPASRELRECLRENRRRGLVQIVSAHELEPLWDLADRLVVVAEGRVAAEGEPAELAERLGDWSVRRPGGGWD